MYEEIFITKVKSSVEQRADKTGFVATWNEPKKAHTWVEKCRHMVYRCSELV